MARLPDPLGSAETVYHHIVTGLDALERAVDLVGQSGQEVDPGLPDTRLAMTWIAAAHHFDAAVQAGVPGRQDWAFELAGHLAAFTLLIEGRAMRERRDRIVARLSGIDHPLATRALCLVDRVIAAGRAPR